MKSFLHFLLSHHEPGRYDKKCYRAFNSSIHVCARCTGLYPAMLVALIAEPFLDISMTASWRMAIFLLLVFPAWLAWAHDVLHPDRPWPRLAGTLTAVPAGLGTGLLLWGHIRNPFHQEFTFVLILCSVLSLAAWFLGRFLNPPEF